MVSGRNDDLVELAKKKIQKMSELMEESNSPEEHKKTFKKNSKKIENALNILLEEMSESVCSYFIKMTKFLPFNVKDMNKACVNITWRAYVESFYGSLLPEFVETLRKHELDIDKNSIVFVEKQL